MKQKQYQIGYTSGVYDLFHIGHLNLLKRAREQCRHLIVGISTDELVMEYKHKSPVIPFAERIQIVESIKYVDEVVPQISMDKLDMWKKLHFEVMFHGDDWKESRLYQDYIKQFKELNVDLVFLPHTTGISSTWLQQSLKG